MSSTQEPDPAASNTAKDPDDWVTGDEPMTGAQRSYLTKAQASEMIDRLQSASPRVDDTDDPGAR